MSSRPCSRCGGEMRLEVDQEGAEEVCRSCGAVHLPAPVLDRKTDRRLALEVVAADRAGKLPPMLCPPCKRRRHDRCHAVRCECPRGEHPKRPVVTA